MAEGFLTRWARLKSAGKPEGEPAPAVPAPAAADAPQAQGPSMEDVRMLAPDADFSRFVARSVDPDVRRLALRTLFSDPHFQQMDGLDIYIDDYTRPSPLPPEMVAALWHARSTLNPQPLYPVREERTTETVTPAEADGDTAALAGDGRPQECEPDATAEPDAVDAAEDSSAEGTPLPFNEHVNFSHGSDADCNTPKSE